MNWSSTASAGMRIVWSSYVTLPPEFESPVTLQRSRDGVQVNHHLNDVTGAVLPDLHVDDDRLGVPLRDQVGLARQRCRPAVEFEAVLSFDVHIKATVLPVCFSLVEERGVVQHPLRLIEVGRDLGPVLLVGLEPDGPLAGVLAGQQPGQPGGPDVGGFSRDGHVCLGESDCSESICVRVRATRGQLSAIRHSRLQRLRMS